MHGLEFVQILQLNFDSDIQVYIHTIISFVLFLKAILSDWTFWSV